MDDRDGCDPGSQGQGLGQRHVNGEQVSCRGQAVDKKPRMEPEVQWVNPPHLGGAGWRRSGRGLGRSSV